MTKAERRHAKWVVALLILALALPLVACGKRSPPRPPPGDKTTFPKVYPNPKQND
jgi:predicted small lipoprotein YifL